MSSTGKDKVWLYVIGGLGAIVIGAIIYNLSSGKASPLQSCLDEIDSLGPAKKESNGILSFNYFKDVVSIVNKYGKAKFSEEKKDLLIARRQALKKKNEEEYRRIIKEIMQKEEMSFGDVI